MNKKEVSINPTKYWSLAHSVQVGVPMIYVTSPNSGNNPLSENVRAFSAYSSGIDTYTPLFFINHRGYKEHKFVVLSRSIPTPIWEGKPLNQKTLYIATRNLAELDKDLKIEDSFGIKVPLNRFPDKLPTEVYMVPRIKERIYHVARKFAEEFAVEQGLDVIVDNISGIEIDPKESEANARELLRLRSMNISNGNLNTN